MKQVIARGGRVVVVDVPAPECRDNELVVKTMCSVISTGTEMWTVEATEPLSPRKLVGDRSKLRKGISLVRKVWSDEGINGVLDYMKEIRNTVVPLGYSLSGVVVEVGKDVSDITLGERVACAGEGKACHAEYVAVPRNLATKLPDGVSFEDGAFAAIGAIAIQGYRRSCAQLGEYVAVLGVGLVGNLTLQICKSAGCRVAALDTRSTRIELAKEVGADAAFHVDDPSLEERLFHFTNGRGFDAVIIGAATSSDGPINLASRICRDKGRVVIIGRIGMNLERKQYYQKELDLVMSRSLGPGRYDANYEEKGIDYPFPYVRWTLNRNMEAFLDMVYQKKVRLNPIVTERYEIAKAERAFDSLKTGASMAVLLTYGSQEVSIPASHSVILDHPHIIGRINVALVGPGNFAKETMIPILRSIKHYNLRWVVASNPINALKASRRYHFQRMGTSYDEVLHDEDSDLLVICTPTICTARWSLKL
jgi:threonine dehydrogenase-like Zn-dependent dehydrogenase